MRFLRPSEDWASRPAVSVVFVGIDEVHEVRTALAARLEDMCRPALKVEDAHSWAPRIARLIEWMDHIDEGLTTLEKEEEQRRGRDDEEEVASF